MLGDGFRATVDRNTPPDLRDAVAAWLDQVSRS
jgi:hypothetical protein